MMKKLVWRDLVGQQRIKEMLEKAVTSGTVGHAYLLCGDEGVGTFQAALEFAMALLCTDQREIPCYRCASCEKVLHYNHPDFNIIMPVVLEKKHRATDGKLSTEGWEHCARMTREKIAHPYLPDTFDGVPGIPVDWIRELNHAITRGPVSGTRMVAIVCGTELMNKESANTMLKTLEEPPAGTVMLLCTGKPQALLPTIVSRCQVVRFGHLSDNQIYAAAKKNLGETAGTAVLDQAVAGAQGSLGNALALLKSPVEEMIERTLALWRLIDEKDWNVIAPRLDQLCSECDHDAFEKLFVHSLFLIRSSFLAGIDGSEKYITTSAFRDIKSLSGIRIDKVRGCIDTCEESLRAVRARGNTGLILTNFLIKVTETLHE